MQISLKGQGRGRGGKARLRAESDRHTKMKLCGVFLVVLVEMAAKLFEDVDWFWRELFSNVTLQLHL